MCGRTFPSHVQIEPEFYPWLSIAVITWGVLDCFFGYKVFKVTLALFGALLGAGLACAGGFTQTTWLTEVKRKLLRLLMEMGLGERAAAIKSIPTKNFSESALAEIKIGGKKVMPTAVDLFLAGRDYYPGYLKSASNLTLGQSLDMAMPTIYEIVVPKSEQS